MVGFFKIQLQSKFLFVRTSPALLSHSMFRCASSSTDQIICTTKPATPQTDQMTRNRSHPLLVCRNTMLDCDDGDEFVLDLVEEVCAASMNIIYSNYLQEQLIPYTVLQAKDAMLEMIEVGRPNISAHECRSRSQTCLSKWALVCSSNQTLCWTFSNTVAVLGF